VLSSLAPDLSFGEKDLRTFESTNNTNYNKEAISFVQQQQQPNGVKDSVRDAKLEHVTSMYIARCDSFCRTIRTAAF
jgi:hypothetical protein